MSFVCCDPASGPGGGGQTLEDSSGARRWGAGRAGPDRDPGYERPPLSPHVPLPRVSGDGQALPPISRWVTGAPAGASSISSRKSPPLFTGGKARPRPKLPGGGRWAEGCPGPSQNTSTPGPLLLCLLDLGIWGSGGLHSALPWAAPPSVLEAPPGVRFRARLSQSVGQWVSGSAGTGWDGVGPAQVREQGGACSDASPSPCSPAPPLPPPHPLTESVMARGCCPQSRSRLEAIPTGQGSVWVWSTFSDSPQGQQSVSRWLEPGGLGQPSCGGGGVWGSPGLLCPLQPPG